MFKELFIETVKMQNVTDNTKDIYKIIKKIKTPLDITIKQEDNFINVYLIGEEIPAGAIKMSGTNTSRGDTADNNEKAFKKFNKEFQSKLKKSKIKIEDYDFFIKNTQLAEIFIVV
jgi:hypothetical protein